MSSKKAQYTIAVISGIDHMETGKPQFPLVSIVIPCWNEENFIASCLLSVKNQTFQNFEVIVVDDSSTDKTPEMIESVIADDPRFQYHRLEKNSGTGTALNFGFERASGSYWTWVAGDSAVEPEFLKEQVEVLNSSPSDVILTYSDCYIQDDISNKTIPFEVPEYNKKLLRVYCFVGPCHLFRREAKLLAGPYCDQICEDYYMHLVMSEFGRFVRVPKRLGMWRNHPNNLTNRVSLKSKWRESCVAKAKARWKVAKRRVAYVCPAFDRAQRGWLLMNTINDNSDRYAMRHIALYETSGNGPFDATPHTLDEVHDILNHADILVMDNSMCETVADLNMLSRIKTTPTILRIRSGLVPPNMQKLLHLIHHYKVRLASCAPGHPLVKWLPNPIPFNTNPKWRGIYESYYQPAFDWPRQSQLIRFLSHHNDSQGKGVDQIADMFESMRNLYTDFPEIEVSISTSPQYQLFDHLNHKKSCDVIIDQITQGFLGMTSWESMLHGAAVIAGMDERTMRAYSKLWGEVPPILNARSLRDVGDYVNHLARSRSMVNEVGQKGRDWMAKHYNAPFMTHLFEDYFDEVIDQWRRPIG